MIAKCIFFYCNNPTVESKPLYQRSTWHFSNCVTSFFLCEPSCPLVGWPVCLSVIALFFHTSCWVMKTPVTGQQIICGKKIRRIFRCQESLRTSLPLLSVTPAVFFASAGLIELFSCFLWLKIKDKENVWSLFELIFYSVPMAQICICWVFAKN